MTLKLHRLKLFAVLLCVMAGITACTPDQAETASKDPEGRYCIPIRRALEIPPKLCPLLVVIDDASVTSEYTEKGYTMPAGKKLVAVPEWTSCTYPKPGTFTSKPEKQHYANSLIQPVGGSPGAGEAFGVSPAYIQNGHQCPQIDHDGDNSTPNVGADNADTTNNQGMKIVEQENFVPCSKAPYAVPLLNEAQPTRGAVQWIMAEVRGLLAPASEQMFKAISKNPEFRTVVIAFATWAILFYAMTVTIQLKQTTIYETLLLFLRIIFFYGFIFHWDVFYTFVFFPLEGDPASATSVGAILELQGAAIQAGVDVFNTTGITTTANVGSAAESYAAIDNVLAGLFSWNMQKFVMALLGDAPWGWMYLLLLIYMFIAFLFSTVAVLVSILMAMLGRMFLYALAPLFLMFGLVDQTRQLFRNWYQLLISFSLQPIFLGASLGLFIAIITMMIGNVISAGGAKLICYTSIGFLSDWIPFLHWWKFTDEFGDYKAVKSLPFLNVYVLLTIVLLCDLQRGTVKWLEDLAKNLSSGLVSMSGGAIHGAQTLLELAKIPLGGMAGGTRGAIAGNKGADGVWRGGLFRDGARGAVEGALTGGGSVMRQQVKAAAETARKEFGKVMKGQ